MSGRVLLVDGRKRCTQCETWKLLDAFHSQRGGPHGRHSWCKSCVNGKNATRSRPGCPKKAQARNLRSRYGETPESIAQRLAKQGGVCAICGKKPSRQILCVRCNLSLGFLESGWYERGLAYLRKHGDA